MRHAPFALPDTRTRYAIDEVRWCSINGVPQSLHVLGRNLSAPLILFLHGGPGLPHMPFAYVNADLADSFIVVHWDQRGAGKTFFAHGAQGTLTVNQLVSDGCELIEQLCTEFGREQLTIIGHSCGSAIGALIAAQFPRRISAFVGVGQVTNLRNAEVIRYKMADRLVSIQGNVGAQRELARIGPPPYSSCAESDRLEQIATAATSGCLNPFDDARYARIAVKSALYTDSELLSIDAGFRYSQSSLWPELVEELDLPALVPRLEMPASFIVGECDVLAPWLLTAEYFQRLHAPRGKLLYRIDKVGHWLHLEAPAAYRTAIVAAVGQLR